MTTYNNNLPYDLEAEKAVLGSILLNREAIIAVAPFLQAPDFYLEGHSAIYAAALSCYQQRTPPDTRTIADALKRAGAFDQAGGIMALSELVDSVPTSYHVEYYARIVERDAIKRRILAATAKMARVATQPDLDADEVKAQAQALLTEAGDRRCADGMTTIGQASERVFDAMTNGIAPGAATGLRDYDRMTGGLHPGNLVVLGGRPGNGKSALALTIADHLAQAGGRVCYVSLEMTAEELAQRLIAHRIGVDLMAIRQHKLNQCQIDIFVNAMDAIKRLPLYIDDAAKLTMPDIRNRALRLVSENGPLALLIVDYLQLISAPERRGMNRAQAVGEISHDLKALAKELKAPVLALVQLNREVEHRASYIPQLADIRESGDIEADADQVVFVVRPELYDAETDKKGIAELYIAKHRGGALGVIPMRFEASTTRFMDLAPYRTDTGHAPYYD